MTLPQRMIAVLTAAAALVSLAGCVPGPTAPSDPLGLTSEHADTYGYGATHVEGVELQPDVVLVAGGPHAIREGSADGLTWRIDRDAPGASELAVGSVMLLTSRATGRVAEVRDDLMAGADAAVRAGADPGPRSTS